MEGVTGLLKEEIKKIVSEENINICKLHEYTQIYERLKSLEVTSVQELENNRMVYGYNNVMSMRTAPIIPDNLGNIMDIFKEAILTMNNSKKDEISGYIFWVRFLKDIRKDIDKKEIVDDLDKLVNDVCNRAIYLMRNRLEDDIASIPSNINPEAML